MRETTSILIAPATIPADLTDEDMEVLGVRRAPIDLSLEQGSLEWSLARSKAITASEVAGIAEESKWAPKTMQAVLLRKMGKGNFSDNPAMAHGRAMEPIARIMLETEFHRPFPAAVMQRGGVLASLDGYDFETQTLVEIKCPYSINQLSEDVPDHYVAQLATQAWVSMAKRVLYCQYFGGTMLVVNVNPDELRKIFLAKYAARVCEAYRHLVDGTLPQEARQDNAWAEAAQEFVETQKIFIEIEEALDACKKRLIELAGDDAASGNGVSVVWVDREGSVNWKAKEIQGALKDAGIKADDFRSKSIRYAKVAVEKQK
jgi:putative phage-type endonuclease